MNTLPLGTMGCLIASDLLAQMAGKGEKKMMRTSPLGVSKENGYVVLRSLLALFIVVLCFASMLAGITIFSHHSAVLLEKTEQEIQNRNEAVRNILK